jgi:hypothetical protein
MHWPWFVNFSMGNRLHMKARVSAAAASAGRNISKAVNSTQTKVQNAITQIKDKVPVRKVRIGAIFSRNLSVLIRTYPNEASTASSDF